MALYLVDLICDCGEILTDGVSPWAEIIAPECHSPSHEGSRKMSFFCVCEKLLVEGIKPGEALVAPECPACEKIDAVPSAEVLLAVYGAPSNWPVEAGAFS